MAVQLWTDDFLDLRRQVMDPLADEVIDYVYQEQDVEGVNKLMNDLVRNDGIPSDQLPLIVLDYLDKTEKLIDVDDSLIKKGEEVFTNYGPEILMILGFYSLPASYAAKKGVQVLYRTAYLTKRPVRRVFETTQMVIDVMTVGGLGPGGRGLRSAQKVRLMHAAIRRLLLTDREIPWNRETLGAPINQEDLAGTLMTFSFLVLEGLERLEIRLKPEEQEAYLHAWQAVGRVMGVDNELIPSNVQEAGILTGKIRQRQIAASVEGQLMTKALVDGMETLLPRPIQGLVPSMIHFFLDSDPFMKENIAKMLDVPPADWTKILVHIITEFSEFVNWFSERSNTSAALMRFFSRHFVEGLLEVERGGNRASFSIPEHLQDEWRLDPNR